MMFNHRLTVAVLVLVAGLFIFAGSDALAAVSGDNQWNFRINAQDFFHSNEAWVRPWMGSDSTRGIFRGNYSYNFAWSATSLIGDANGAFSLTYTRDHQAHAWTYVYVQEAKSITLEQSSSWGVAKWFLNSQFDSPYERGATLNLRQGWNRIDWTDYDQNNWWSFNSRSLAGLVDVMNHESVDLTPVAAFTVTPAAGWAGVTAFDFLDASTGSPDSWRWDLESDGFVDVYAQNATGRTFAAPAGGEASYDVTLEVESLGLTDSAQKAAAVTVYGSPLAGFSALVDELTVSFANSSSEPGKAELGGYAYDWDLDGDGIYGDSYSETPDWTYAEAGDYYVSLLVTNGAGSDAYSQMVTVVPEPATLVLLGGGFGMTLSIKRRRRKAGKAAC